MLYRAFADGSGWRWMVYGRGEKPLDGDKPIDVSIVLHPTEQEALEDCVRCLKVAGIQADLDNSPFMDGAWQSK